MRQIVRECRDLFFVQGKRDFRHGGRTAALARAGLVILQRLEELILALSGEARGRLGTGIGIEMA